MKTVDITVKGFKSDDELRWFNRHDKWRITCTNTTNAEVFISWDEIDEVITDLQVDESPDAGKGLLLDFTGGICRSYVHSGSLERRIAPHRFLEVQISPGQSSEWVMEKPRQSSRFRFSFRSVSLWKSWTHDGKIPEPDQRVQPKGG
jgi:hypothetical protein